MKKQLIKKYNSVTRLKIFLEQKISFSIENQLEKLQLEWNPLKWHDIIELSSHIGWLAKSRQ